MPNPIPNATMNGYRLQVELIKKITEILLAMFHSIYPTDPEMLFNELKKQEQYLYSLKKKGILNKIQYSLIFPKTGKTLSKKLDTTIISVFLHRKKGKNRLVKVLDKNDKEMSCLLTKYRDIIQHLPAQVSDVKFCQIFDEASSVLEKCGVSKEELDKIRFLEFDPEKTIESLKKETQMYREHAETEIKRAVTARNRSNHYRKCKEEGVIYDHRFIQLPEFPKFTGRQKELREIHQQLGDLTLSNEVGVVVSGIAGAGKSELARKYCNEYQKHYENNILWINAEHTSNVIAAFQDIASIIKLPVKYPDGKPYTSSLVAKIVYQFFGKSQCLFVFDNVNNIHDILAFFPTHELDIKPSILFTSQRRDLGHMLRLYELNVLSREDAYLFFESSVEQKFTVNDEAKDELLNLLNCHPLALKHAVSYMNDNQLSCHEYSMLIRSSNVENPVMATINLALSKLYEEKDSQSAITVLDLISHIDGKKIQKGFLMEMFPEEESRLDKMIEVNDAATFLKRYSLVNIPESCNFLESDDPLYFEKQVLTIHSLVQTAVIENQRKRGCFQNVFNDLLNIMFIKSDKKHSYYIDVGHYWWYHLIHIFQETELQEILLPMVASNIQFLTNILSSKYQDDVLIEICDKILNSCYEYNCVDRMMMQLFHYNCYYRKGEFTRALKLTRKLELDARLVLPPNHLSILLIQNALALCFRENGNFKKEVRLMQGIEHAYLEKFESNHPSVITAQENLAGALHSFGDFSAAIKVFEKLEKCWEKTVLSDHPEHFTVQINHAESLRKIGHLKAAITKNHKILEACDKVCPEHHESLLTIKNNLALCLVSIGDIDEAIKILTSLEAVYLNVSENLPGLLKVQRNLACCFKEVGDLNKSILKHETVEKLLLTKSNLPPNHIEVLKTRNQIARCLLRIGDNQNVIKAKEIFQWIEKTYLQVHKLPKDHLELLFVQNNVAVSLQESGEIELALQKFQEVESVYIQKFQSTQPNQRNLLNVQHSVAVSLSRNGKNEEAFKKFQKVIQLQLQKFGHFHPQSLLFQHSYARCLLDNNYFNEAQGLLEKVKNGYKELKLSNKVLELENDLRTCQRKRYLYSY